MSDERLEEITVTWEEVEPLVAEALERRMRRTLVSIPLPRWEA